MADTLALILAAGEGKRMKSRKSKVTHEICGKPMIKWVYDAAAGAGIKDFAAVVGSQSQQIREILGNDIKFVVQEKQLGTAHAVMQARDILNSMKGYVIVLYGDTPLVTSETIKAALDYHIENNFSATIITAEFDEPFGYGRIVRDADGNVCKIVEERDATLQEKAIKEINSGMICFNTDDLLMCLERIDNHNDQGEYYLTDSIEILIREGKSVGALKVKDGSEILGVNDRLQLYQASEAIRKRINENLMKSGVTLIDPASTYINADVEIGIDTVIYPGVILEAGTKIGEDCIIGPNSRIVSSVIGNNVEVNNSIVLESSIGDGTKVGPFAYIRPGSVVGCNVKIGDFVELKKADIGDKTKISHLTYVGDAKVGKNVNIGCGVVFVNYDGKQKHKTIVGDNAFIGCNTNLVAPVTVGNDSYIAAGSTITEEVPEHALAIARERQVNKEGWVIKRGMQRR